MITLIVLDDIVVINIVVINIIIVFKLGCRGASWDGPLFFFADTRRTRRLSAPEGGGKIIPPKIIAYGINLL